MLSPCADHIHRTRQKLYELAKLYAECAHLIAPPQGGSIRERVTGSRSPNMVNDAMVEIRSAIHTALGSWALRLCHEKGIREIPVAVSNMVDFLAVHLVWFAGQPSWADFSQDVDDLLNEVDNAVNGTPEGPILLGPCIRLGCPGFITLSGSGAASRQRQEVVCDRGHQWLPHQWLLLKERIDNVTAEDRS